MSTPMSPAIAHNIWFGHYNPAITLQPLTQGQMGMVAGALQTPMTQPAHVRDFFSGVGRWLPAFKRVATAMEAPDVRIVMSPDAPHPLYVERTTGERCVMLPPGTVPIHGRGFIFGALTMLLPTPEGLVLPAMRAVPSIDDANKLLWTQHYWQTALVMSLEFQAAVEMNKAGIRFASGPMKAGFLGAVDLALFRIFRERGLAGLAESYSHFMMPDQRQGMSSFIDTRAANMVEGGARTFDWSPPVLGERPSLEKTFLDDVVDRFAHLERGLYVKAEGLSPLSDSVKSYVDGLLSGRVSSISDIRDIIDAMRIIAPVLAQKILTDEAIRKIRFEITSDLPGDHVAAAEDVLNGLLGMRRNGIADALKIFIRRGAPKQDAMRSIVTLTSHVSIPEDLHQGEIMRPDLDSMASFMERVHARKEMWGWSAYFEFVHEAALRGVELPPMESLHEEMREVLERCGYGVLCEQWSRFSNPADLRLMRSLLRASAAEVQRLLQAEGSD